jgi:hypothetical protein
MSQKFIQNFLNTWTIFTVSKSKKNEIVHKEQVGEGGTMTGSFEGIPKH